MGRECLLTLAVVPPQCFVPGGRGFATACWLSQALLPAAPCLDVYKLHSLRRLLSAAGPGGWDAGGTDPTHGVGQLLFPKSQKASAAKKYFLAHNLHRIGLRRSRSACWRERWRGGTTSWFRKPMSPQTYVAVMFKCCRNLERAWSSVQAIGLWPSWWRRMPAAALPPRRRRRTVWQRHN